MNYCFRFGLIILFFLVCKNAFTQGPVFGGELSWRQLNGDTVLIEEHVWETCGHDLSDFAKTVYLDDPSGIAKGIALSEKGARNFTPLCNIYTSCSTGIEPYLITDHVLSAKAVIPYCSFRIYIQLPGASSSLTTTGYGYMYLECEGNKCLKGKNSCPAFMDDPSVVVYENQCTTIYNRADISGGDSAGRKDSISYKLISPQYARNSPFAYKPGYSYDQPVRFKGSNKSTPFYPYCSGFHADTTTGELNFEAWQTDKTLLAMQANEWRKDSSGPVLVGSTMRCWEMDVVHENDNLYFSPASFGGSNKVYCYAGVHDTVSFSAYSYVDTNIRSINIQVMDSLPKGASFIIKKAKYPSGYSAYNYFTIGQVCWTPSNKEIGKQPFRICLQAKDTLCPYPDLVQETALLYVIPKPDTIQLSINNAVQCANKNLFQCKVHVNDKAYLCRYRFSYGDSTAVTSDMTHTYARAGSYKITLIVLLGGDTIGIKDTVVNVLQGPPKPDFASYNRKLYCSGTERNMYFQNKTPYDSATTYFWRFSDGKVSFDYNAVHAFPIKPRYGSATLIAKKGTCLDSISYDFRIPQTKTISVAGIHPSLKKTKNCHSYQFYSNLDTTLIDSVTSVTWDFGDGSRPVINVMNPKHTFSSGSTQTYSVNCIVSDGECSLSNSISLTDTVINISISSPDSICAGRAVSFKAVGDVNKVKAKDIKWSFGNGDSASGAAVVYTYLKSGKHKVSISYPDDFCIRASSIDVFMKPWLYPVISGNISPSAGHDTLVYSLDQGVNIKHKWSVISGTLISRPDADTAAIVWYDTLEYSGKVMCDFDTTQCIDRAEFIVYPHSSGLQENVKGNDAFKVYPDPTAGNVMLEFDDQKEHQWQLSIMDVTGKQLYHEVFKGVAGVQRKELSLTAFPPGTYYLKLSSTDHQAVRKLIKL